MDRQGGTREGENGAGPIKILVIDGEEAHCRLYKEELEEDGYKVLTATTWPAGMDLFRKETPDLVTIDVCMTDCEERIKLLGKIKEINPGVPIILLTSYDYQDDFHQSYVDAYVLKSSDLSELKSTIKSTTSFGNNL
jgi:DNA-binding NtrC family response regulator